MAKVNRSIRVGVTPSAGGGEGIFFSLEDGQQAEMILLANRDELVSVDQYAMWDYKPAPVWVDTGAPDDPGRELGLKSQYRAFIPVWLTIDGVKQVKLWSVGIGVHREIEDIDGMVDGLKGLKIRAKRTGSGLKTRYKVISTGSYVKTGLPEYTVEMVIDNLGPDSRESIIELIENRTGQSYESLKNSSPDSEVEESDF